ncbi:hypothetical protein B0J17DRAFT_725067 [Rhizoctonia solani]|nr:hypothetical protein B0J17DRAFT_725067 [Rhizoctonia solani]
MTGPISRLFDPPKSHELYTLGTSSTRLENEPVFVYVTPCEGSHWIIESEDDSKFNLSNNIGLNTHKHFGVGAFWVPFRHQGSGHRNMQSTPKNTNVVKLVELLKKDDPPQQMAGVGTYLTPGYLTDVGQAVAATTDEFFAIYLCQHVIDGYKYLMETYRAGDQVSIFGFSRGAYTARALAGMLHSVGLLSRHNVGYLEQALALDKNRGNCVPSVWDHSKTVCGQSVLEVWFKGGHCDVGGGTAPVEEFIPDDTAPGEQVARWINIPLRWMAMRRYRKHKILEERRPGDNEDTYLKNSAVLDEVDVIKAPHLMQDKWSLKGLGWWILDKLPGPKLSQEITAGLLPNNGAPRIINLTSTQGSIRLHASVYTHLQKYAEQGGKDGKEYIPAALYRGWKKDNRPSIEEGETPSIMSPSDEDSASLRNVLDMGWEGPKQT